MERIIDICAHELAIPADEMRLKNYITEFPYTTPNGCIYDSGNYPGMVYDTQRLHLRFRQLPGHARESQGTDRLG